MPRRKPTSQTAKKAAQKLKRAIKRGEAPAPSASQQSSTGPRRPKRPGHPSRPGATQQQQNPTRQKDAEVARRLESRFLRVSPSYLQLSTGRASNDVLRRPVEREKALFPQELVDGPSFSPPPPAAPAEPREGEEGETGKEKQLSTELTCPRRPKWRYGQTKLEVERNEEGVFARWREETEAKFERWRRAEAAAEGLGKEGARGAPSYYEWNLEVWRQLWRVTELSDILLVLLDARCPPLHYPPSLRTYLASQRPQKKIILVLTKVDVVGPVRAEAWAAWLRKRYGGEGVRVVCVESYRVKVSQAEAEAAAGTEGEKKKSGRRVEPYLPIPFRQQLIAALKEAHEELCTPPAHIATDEDKLRKWKCRVRREVDWVGLERALGQGRDVRRPVDGHATGTQDGQLPLPEQEEGDDEQEDKEYPPPEYLTIGLIGQPNVGKSSLLNALFGRPRVRASRTPGKTKHFQTLFLSRDVRLVDCPGLVLPAYVRMELQALAGVLPIAQMPSLPGCVWFAGQYLPLERVLGLRRVADEEREEMERKKTWRDGERPSASASASGGRGGVGEREEGEKWTAMQILEAYALEKGWITAKVGRPDTNRAGNAIMRLLAEAKIPWGFLPPGSDLSSVEEGEGIWLNGQGERDSMGGETDGESTVYTDSEEEEEEGEGEEGSEEEGSEEGNEEDEREEVRAVKSGLKGLKIGGGFAALAQADEEEDGEDEEEEEDEDEEEK